MCGPTMPKLDSREVLLHVADLMRDYLLHVAEIRAPSSTEEFQAAIAEEGRLRHEIEVWLDKIDVLRAAERLWGV